VAVFISYDTLTGSSARTPRSWTHLPAVRCQLATHSARASAGPALMAARQQKSIARRMRLPTQDPHLDSPSWRPRFSSRGRPTYPAVMPFCCLAAIGVIPSLVGASHFLGTRDPWHLRRRCLVDAGIAVTPRQILLEHRREPALLCLEERLARQAEPESIGQTAHGGIFAELAHGDRVIRLAADPELLTAHLQQINRLSMRHFRVGLVSPHKAANEGRSHLIHGHSWPCAEKRARECGTLVA
jgi:hypothetical protein